jgi:ribose-phosphate pyrophosphokinase
LDKINIDKPILIGRMAKVSNGLLRSQNANAPYVILTKVRYSDRDVEVSIPHVAKYKDFVPVLVDDIISTGRTMIETIGHLNRNETPICIGVHAVFAENVSGTKRFWRQILLQHDST